MHNKLAEKYLKRIARVFHELSEEEMEIATETIEETAEERIGQRPSLRLVAGSDTSALRPINRVSRHAQHHLLRVK